MEGPIELCRPDICNVCGKKTYRCYYQIVWGEPASGGPCALDGLAPMLACICDKCSHN